jgi:RNA polymerase sigma factor (sigma-70 family)
LRELAAGETADGPLLRRFLEEHDEAAFAALLQRHGPLVLGVCQRILRDAHAAEDAFQATFLVLVRKARSIARPDLLGNWLYGVACRTARKAKTDAARRQAREARAQPRSAGDAAADVDRADLRRVLDEEVSRLPSRYRLPFVLCYLEGKTNEEAAHLVGCPRGTVLSRLAWARERLRGRLARRGVALSAGLLADALVREARAAVPPPLATATSQAGVQFAVTGVLSPGLVPAGVLSLTVGVCRIMALTRIKVVAILFALLGASGMAGLFSYRGRAEMPKEVKPPPAGPGDRPARAGPDRRAPEAEALDARAAEALKRWRKDWKIVAVDRKGTQVYINLGTADRVTPNLTFSIHSLGPDGKLSKAKGTLEVVQVIGPHLSRARVTSVKDSSRDPVMRNDRLFNPTWDPEKRSVAATGRKLDARALLLLRKKKLSVAATGFTAANQRFIAGHDSAEEVYTWSRRWLEAEMEVNRSKAGRLAALRDHFQRMKELEKVVQARSRDGKVTVKDLSTGQFARREAEILLRQAQGE